MAFKKTTLNPYWNFMFILKDQQHFDMTLPSLLKVF